MNLDLVQSIATDVRYWAEGVAEGTYKEGDLNGMCAIASAELWRHLNRKGIKAELHGWICPQDEQSAHVFLVVDDHVVDITATQFSKLKNKIVFIEHKKMAERWDWYRSQDVFNDPKELIRWQKTWGWPGDQVARSK
tara:strand:+ start:137 stop:547 length:411 start_codon:yes stop_codon:yes gene_type:complete